MRPVDGAPVIQSPGTAVGSWSPASRVWGRAVCRLRLRRLRTTSPLDYQCINKSLEAAHVLQALKR